MYIKYRTIFFIKMWHNDILNSFDNVLTKSASYGESISESNLLHEYIY